MGVRTALIYDFDGTLSPGAMQQHTLIPALGFTEVDDFWAEVKRRKIDADGDEILTYMHYLLECSGDKLISTMLRSHGKKLPFFQGVEDWFDRINVYGERNRAPSLPFRFSPVGRRKSRSARGLPSHRNTAVNIASGARRGARLFNLPVVIARMNSAYGNNGGLPSHHLASMLAAIT